jgi:uncharacterized protein YbjT (DUF2867 family)
MSEKSAVLVTGATGQQGGAVARELLKRGHRVRATTRKVDSAAARELARQGAELVKADFEDIASLERAAAGMDAVFAMATPFEAGMVAETREGINVVNAARAADVKHIVYSSVAGADQNTGIPHFDSKYLVEERLRTLDTPFTIIAPVYFMENLLAPWNTAGLKAGVIAMGMPAGRKLQQVAIADIAEFTAEVITRPREFAGQRIDIASDDITGTEMAAIVSRASGRQFNYVEVPLEQVRAGSEDMALMYEWFNRVGYHADVKGLRLRYPEVGWHTFEAWTAEQDWTRLT